MDHLDTPQTKKRLKSFGLRDWYCGLRITANWAVYPQSAVAVP